MNLKLSVFMRLLLIAAGGVVLAAMMKSGLESLAAPGIPVLWWCARALGLLAFAALWLSMACGVLMAAKGGGGLVERSTVAQLHQHWTLVAVAATVLHVVFVVIDPASGVSALAAALPFTSATLTGPVAVGTFAGWGLALLIGSSVLSSRLARGTWRALHASAFGTFVLALVHAATAGSDWRSLSVRWALISATALLVAAIAQRLLLASHRRRTTFTSGEAP